MTSKLKRVQFEEQLRALQEDISSLTRRLAIPASHPSLAAYINTQQPREGVTLDSWNHLLLQMNSLFVYL